ncbi:MAG: sulfatase [Planctomycetales bacterium 71-10]|nr:MAG: sulfatase [Planctomycetales bacterium 71-10]
MNCQDRLHRGRSPLDVSRRWFLNQCGVGLGAMALRELIAADAAAGSPAALDPMAPKAPHFAPKAKRVIFLFMAGGPSHLEMFDNKPQLAKFDGTLPPAELLKGYRAAFINPDAKLLGPKFKFAKHGNSGTEVSELLPHTASVIDEIAVVKGMHTDAFNHAPGQIMMSTGSMIFGRPSLGAWTCYGLGSEANDLPGFVVFSTGKKGPSGGNSNWGSGFLPTVYQGVQFRTGGDPVLYLSNPEGVDQAVQRDSLDAIHALDQHRLDAMGDPEIATRINSYETAYRMQMSAPDVMDLSREPKHILDLYGAEPGKGSFAGTCLLARRLLERGVRFVEIFHEAWDQHGNLTADLKNNCAETDRACAALILDLKQRGMLDDTLVVWGGEFGRTPMVQGGSDGRDHHPNAFTMWLAGGGAKPGISHGVTDDLGFGVADQKVHVHDLNATILHLLGFDHTKLTYRFQGRDFRLTDVHGRVVSELLA